MRWVENLTEEWGEYNNICGNDSRLKSPKSTVS